MADVSDLAVAARVLADPGASRADLVAIARAHPGLRVWVAEHPNAYPELLAWLDGLGDPALSRVVAERQAGFDRASDPVTFVSAPPPPPAQTADAPRAASSAGAGRPSGVRVPRWVVAVAIVVAVALIAGVAYLVLRRSPEPAPAPVQTPTTSSTIRVVTQTSSPTVSTPPTASTPSPSTPTPSVRATSATTSTGPVRPWAETFKGSASGGPLLTAVVVDSDGSLVVAGSTTAEGGPWARRHGGGDHNDNDAIAARLAPDGTLLWATVLGTSLWDWFGAVALLPGGDIVAVGSSASMGLPDPAASAPDDFSGGGAIAARLRPDGSTVWTKSYGSSLWSRFRDVTVATDGTIMAAGAASPNDSVELSVGGNGVIAALSPDDGSVLWSQVQPQADFQAVRVVGEGGTVVVAGCAGPGCQSNGYEAGAQWFNASYTEDGSLRWQRRLPGDLRGLVALAVGPDGTLAAVGWRGSAPGSVASDATVTRLTGDGSAAVWTHVFAQTNLRAVTVGPDGGIIAVGETTAPGGDITAPSPATPAANAPIRPVIARFGADGSLTWTQTGAGWCPSDCGLYAVAFTDPAATGLLVSGLTFDTQPDPGSPALVARLAARGTLG